MPYRIAAEFAFLVCAVLAVGPLAGMAALPKRIRPETAFPVFLIGLFGFCLLLAGDIVAYSLAGVLILWLLSRMVGRPAPSPSAETVSSRRRIAALSFGAANVVAFVLVLAWGGEWRIFPPEGAPPTVGDVARLIQTRYAAAGILIAALIVAAAVSVAMHAHSQQRESPDD